MVCGELGKKCWVLEYGEEVGNWGEEKRNRSETARRKAKKVKINVNENVTWEGSVLCKIRLQL